MFRKPRGSAIRPFLPAALATALLLAIAGPVLGASESGLDASVHALRRIDPSSVTEENREEMSLRVDAAWRSLGEAGEAGAERLVAELRTLDRSGEADDFFRLGAGALIFLICGEDRAADVAAAWDGARSFDANYSYVFYTAFEAARSRTLGASPILLPLLRDRDGSVFLELHQLPVRWPLTLKFVYGVRGAAGPAELRPVLDSATDPVTLRNAIVLLAEDVDERSRPSLRRLAARTDAVGSEAIRALGVIGHPDDFDLLASLLRSGDAERRLDGAFALWEYEDLRAVPLLRPLLEDPDERVRDEARGALFHLACRASWDPLAAEPSRPDETPSAEFDAYKAADSPKRNAILARWRKHSNDVSEEFSGSWAARVAEFRRTGTFDFDRAEPPDTPEDLAPLRATDLPALLELRAFYARRLSDECLGPISRIDRLIRHSARLAYRRETGLTERAVR